MKEERTASGPALPDLTDAGLDEIMTTTDSALAQALRRVLRQATATESPISAYQSGAQFFLPDGDG